MITAHERQAIQPVRQASEDFGEALYALTSFGNESALLFHIVEKAGVEVEFVTIDTGFWFPETHDFKDQLTAEYGRDVRVYRPDAADVATIERTRLWEKDPHRYHEITKREPLSRAVAELGIKGLLSGVRADQTANRATLETVEPGRDGEIRIHPLLHWSEARSIRYFQPWCWPNFRGLPRHPLHAKGYGSIGDWTTTKPGIGREGRELPNSECGLHVAADGKRIRTAA